uniref:Uncharacterized protein n=1 Tax=Cacopsylla melanoneura TaxID=428564 RepID=A0A8D9BEJ3_9HEMI
MVSVSYLCTLFERFGMINFRHFGSKWRQSVQTVYGSVLFWLFVCRNTCQCYNALTRATRFLPELIQVLLETTIFAFMMYIAYFFKKGKWAASNTEHILFWLRNIFC